MISHKIYNLNVNEDFVIFRPPKLTTCFIDGFTSGMKSQSIAYLLLGSAHINWNLDLAGEVHLNMGFLVKRPSKKQRQCYFPKLGKACINFG